MYLQLLKFRENLQHWSSIECRTYWGPFLWKQWILQTWVVSVQCWRRKIFTESPIRDLQVNLSGNSINTQMHLVQDGTKTMAKRVRVSLWTDMKILRGWGHLESWWRLNGKLFIYPSAPNALMELLDDVPLFKYIVEDVKMVIFRNRYQSGNVPVFARRYPMWEGR